MTDRRYRVLFVASHPVQYQAPLFQRLATHPNFDMHVAYCSLRGAELIDDYPWTHVPNRGSGAESFLGLCNAGLWTLIRRGKYDVVVSYVGYVRASFWIAYLAAKASNSGFVFGTDATTLAPRDGRAWKAIVKKFLWPKLFGLADQVIVPSTAGVDFMRSLGIPADRITLTPFVVDNDWWMRESSQVDRGAVRASLGVSLREAVILFCAKLQPWKRPQDLLRAFAKANIPDTLLVFAGEGVLRSQLESEAEQLGVAGRVRFLGFVNQSGLPAVYTAADLFVLPSEYDACPVVVCEAMLCGCPVVISDQIRGRFDLVRAGITGDIFTCGDLGALATSLRKILSDPGRLRELSESARNLMKTWSPEQNVVATLGAIRTAASRTGRPAVAIPLDSSDPDTIPAAGQKLRK